MDVPPDRVLGYRERVLRPGAEARAGAFAASLLASATDAFEGTGIGLAPQRRPDGRRVVFGVDLGVTLGFLEVGLIRGAIDAHALGFTLIAPGDLTESRAQACGHKLLRRQLAPGSDAWPLGSWMPLPNRDGLPGFGLTHGLFMPLALAEPDMGPETAEDVARWVDLVRAWLEEGAPAPDPLPFPEATARERLVARQGRWAGGRGGGRRSLGGHLGPACTQASVTRGDDTRRHAVAG